MKMGKQYLSAGINCKAEISEKLTVADIDLCVIMGNLIDNAVESCRKMPEDAGRFLHRDNAAAVRTAFADKPQERAKGVGSNSCTKRRSTCTD